MKKNDTEFARFKRNMAKLHAEMKKEELSLKAFRTGKNKEEVKKEK